MRRVKGVAAPTTHASPAIPHDHVSKKWHFHVLAPPERKLGACAKHRNRNASLGWGIILSDNKALEMLEQEDFEERFRACREMPGVDDPVYDSTYSEIVREMGGSVTYGPNMDPELKRRLEEAQADDRRRFWSALGTTPMDARLAAFSDLYLEAGPEQKMILTDHLVDQTMPMFHFAFRAGQLVDVTKDPQWLRRGFAAASIHWLVDFRDLFRMLSILRYGAHRAGIDPAGTFREFLDHGPPTIESGPVVSFEEILLQAAAYSHGKVKRIARRFGPPEWRAEIRPWWRLW